MQEKILVLDIDGTLTNSKKEITEATKRGIWNILQHGHKVILASGRPTPGMRGCEEELELKKISAVHGRAEELARQKGYREQFDLCVSRAVANLSTLSEYCLPFVKVGGKFISYKANEVEEETKQAEHALEVLGGACVDIQKFQLPDSEMNRAFVIIEKKKRTPATYPRKAGTPSKKPL